MGHHACKYDSRQYQKLNDYKGEDCKAQQAAPASAICFKQVSPLSSITTRINVCTSLCSPGTNLALMKTFDSFSTALQCCPTPWWRAVSAGPAGEMQPNWLLFIIEWRTMWKPALLPLPPHFPNLFSVKYRLSSVELGFWGSLVLFFLLAAGMAEDYFMFWGTFIIWNSSPQLSTLLVASKHNPS